MITPVRLKYVNFQQIEENKVFVTYTALIAIS